MKEHLIIAAEGPTERSFIDEILRPYFFRKYGLYDIRGVTLDGVSKYSIIRRDLIDLIYKWEENSVISTMLDFYGLPTDCPGMKEPQRCHLEQAKLVEKRIKEDIEGCIRSKKKTWTFIPYIQLHEFEALLFSSEKGVENLFESQRVELEKFKRTMEKFPNPEDINNNYATKPSARMKGIIREYNKVSDGPAIMKEIGVEVAMLKCPHFKEWIEKLKDAIMETTPDSNAG